MAKTLFERVQLHLADFPELMTSESPDLYKVLQLIATEVAVEAPSSEAEKQLIEFYCRTSRIYLAPEALVELGEATQGTEEERIKDPGMRQMLKYYLPIIWEFINSKDKTRIEDLSSFSRYVEFLDSLVSTPSDKSMIDIDGSISFGPGSMIMPKSFIFSLFGLTDVKVAGICVP